jgi:hypothetical protein
MQRPAPIFRDPILLGRLFDRREKLMMNETQIADDPQRRLDDDYHWGVSDPEILRVYSGQVVAIHRRKVLGAGRDHLQALGAARRDKDCPERQELAFVVVPYATADFDPAFATRFRDEDVQRRYGGLVVAVHQNSILGAGNDREGAWRAAQRQPHCPAPDEVRYLLIPAPPGHALTPSA